MPKGWICKYCDIINYESSKCQNCFKYDSRAEYDKKYDFVSNGINVAAQAKIMGISKSTFRRRFHQGKM